ncbi:ABC transporter permease [Williamsia sp.]|uniref:ABC transporter permease n=1 Tax=Williamsia sp. TaxID=1872085 RepID=UPI002F9505DB
MMRVRSLCAVAWLPIALLVAWEVIGRTGSSVYLPPLSKVLDVFFRDWFPGAFRDDLVPSMIRFAAGFVIAAVLGIAIGIVIGSNTTVSEYTSPILEFMRCLPAVAVIPVAVYVFGLGDSMRVAVIVFGAFFPILVNSIQGARSARRERLEVAQMYGLSRFQMVRRVVFPSALPMISAGLRVALPISLIMMVLSEIVGGSNGVGFYMELHQDLFDIPALFSAIIVLGIVGNIVNGCYGLAERKVLVWAQHA